MKFTTVRRFLILISTISVTTRMIDVDRTPAFVHLRRTTSRTLVERIALKTAFRLDYNFNPFHPGEGNATFSSRKRYRGRYR